VEPGFCWHSHLIFHFFTEYNAPSHRPSGMLVVCNYPAAFDTDRQRFMAERIVSEEGGIFDEAKAKIAHIIAARRLGRPEEFGAACAFLCSVQASYISGQNLQRDGGSYPGLV
jgi:NAD(P)-dependent dehydrogenase (short-subunit alcohol dehydrogenase family)